ncbi:unnamed protein product [Urochloa decumbens]|uniref:F-box domain-containing protein n=1 Tax=Urochloa decumbens TaxID=240449 RepID=A0ABC9D694_9POAL
MAPTPPMGSSSRFPVAAGDRLSSLPNDILHTIMSFLPVQQAVQTCVLSWRWRHLWCSMPCLNIDQQEFNSAASGASEGSQFEEFVNSLLMFHSATRLDVFRFRFTHNYEFKVVERWIRRGMKCFPAVMEICRSSSGRFYMLPPLGSSAYRLKRLHLIAISLDKSFTQQLRFGFVLEDLKLDRCHLHSPEIKSNALKNMIITDCTTDSGCVLTITTPALVSFYLAITVVGSNWDGVLVNEMPALVNAKVCLKQASQYTSISPKGPCKLLCSLTNVRNLELSGLKALSILHGKSDAFPTFPNLRTLLFNECDLSDDFQMLGFFLNNTHSLEKLTLQYCKLPEGSKKRKRMQNPKRISLKCQDTLTFRCPNLKLTEIKYKEDDVHQLFGLLSGIWRNLRKTTIMLTKA